MSETPAAVARTATIPNALRAGPLTLLGTLTSPTGSVALMRSNNGKVHRLNKGDKVSGATVTAISDGEVIVVEHGAAKRYSLPNS